jgi:hypothetical protein
MRSQETLEHVMTMVLPNQSMLRYSLSCCTLRSADAKSLPTKWYSLYFEEVYLSARDYISSALAAMLSASSCLSRPVVYCKAASSASSICRSLSLPDSRPSLWILGIPPPATSCFRSHFLQSSRQIRATAIATTAQPTPMAAFRPVDNPASGVVVGSESDLFGLEVGGASSNEQCPNFVR